MPPALRPAVCERRPFGADRDGIRRRGRRVSHLERNRSAGTQLRSQRHPSIRAWPGRLAAADRGRSSLGPAAPERRSDWRGRLLRRGPARDRRPVLRGCRTSPGRRPVRPRLALRRAGIVPKAPALLPLRDRTAQQGQVCLAPQGVRDGHPIRGRSGQHRLAPGNGRVTRSRSPCRGLGGVPQEILGGAAPDLGVRERSRHVRRLPGRANRACRPRSGRCRAARGRVARR